MGTGMAAGEWMHQHPVWRLTATLCFAAFLLCLLVFRNRPIGALFAVLTLYACGNWIWNRTEQRNDSHHYMQLPAKGIWKAELLEDADGKGKFAGATASLLAYTDSTGRHYPANGRIRLLFHKRATEQPVCGNTYYIYGELTGIQGPQLPEAFDYREYLSRKQIYRQLRADSGTIRFLRRNISIRALAADLARNMEQRLNTLPDPTRAGLVVSLITGDKRGVTDEDREHFARTGTLHVLAVSGLHVGIIYGILLFLTGRFFRRNHPAQAVVILLFVWAYALVSGLAPSVFRAAFMFSLLSIGGVMSSRSKGLNTLAGTAVCMLAIEPRWLQDIGFLLSFSAVGGIMLFYQRIEKAWQPRSKALLYIWKMSAVSIAAQLGTLPVTLYCFNSFPLWFLPANLLVIPISTLCLICGLALLLCAGLPAIGNGLLWLTDLCLHLLQLTVGKLAAMPMHSIGGIYPNTAAVAAMLFLLLLLASWPILARRYRVAGILLGLLGLSAAESQRQWSNRFAQTEVYALRWQQGIAIVTGGRGEGLLMTDRLRKGQADTLRMGLEKWLRRKGIKKVAMLHTGPAGGDGMIRGRHYRLSDGKNLYLERVSVHFETKKRNKGIWLRRRETWARQGAIGSISVISLNNQTLPRHDCLHAHSHAGIGLELVELPKAGYIRL